MVQILFLKSCEPTLYGSPRPPIPPTLGPKLLTSRKFITRNGLVSPICNLPFKSATVYTTYCATRFGRVLSL